jgi:hypothetical protein
LWVHSYLRAQDMNFATNNCSSFWDAFHLLFTWLLPWVRVVFTFRASIARLQNIFCFLSLNL